MERYFIDIDELSSKILQLPLENKTFIPVMKEYNLLSLMLLKYGEDQEYIIIGKRQGEKMREKLYYDDEEVVWMIASCISAGDSAMGRRLKWLCATLWLQI